MSLCPHGYTAFWDCPHCEEPMGTAPAKGIGQTLTWVELRTLQPGQRFLFYADDLEHRGPCTLVALGTGVATIRYEPHTVVRRFKARDRRGQIVEREICQTLSGESKCALGAQVVPLDAKPGIPPDVDPTPLEADDVGDPDDGAHL